ncbi:MAG: polymerase subunit delta, partial [Candidatus Parcubacteria bacterium]
MSTKKSSRQSVKQNAPAPQAVHAEELAIASPQKRTTHAYVIAAPLTRTNAYSFLARHLDLADIAQADFHVYESADGSVDDIRLLRDRVSLKSHGQQSLHLVCAESLTLQAQNAFLKTLEDTPLGVTVVIAVQNPRALIPTILSRVIFIDTTKNDYTKCDTLVHELLGTPIPQRIQKVEELLETMSPAAFVSLCASAERQTNELFQSGDCSLED